MYNLYHHQQLVLFTFAGKKYLIGPTCNSNLSVKSLVNMKLHHITKPIAKDRRI